MTWGKPTEPNLARTPLERTVLLGTFFGSAARPIVCVWG